MKIITNQDPCCSPDQRYVIWWIRRIELNYPLWQNEAHKIREHPDKSVCRCNVHKSNVWIVQQTFYRRRVRTAHEESRICIAIFQCLNCGITREWKQRSGVGVYVGPPENAFCVVTSAASLRSYSNAFSFELSEAVERLAG